MRLEGKKALVTAAGQGIGHASAIAMAKEGAQVFATDINPELLKHFATVTNIQTHVCDVLSMPAIEQLHQAIGEVDILFNCAGYVHQGDIFHTSDQEWDFSMDLNVKSMFRTIQTFLPAMLEKKSGSVINISSAASSIKGAQNRLVYATSKAAVLGLTRALAADYVATGVRFNSICPGTVASPSLDGRIADLSAQTGKSIDEVRQMFVGRQPLGRLGSAEEIAALVVYLASDESAFTTGTAQIIDGGWSL
jgi:2-keto-3-deoxy-L-fuconate dehydrogenase